MSLRGAERDQGTPEAAVAPDVEEDELDLEPPNSLLVYQMDEDGLGFSDLDWEWDGGAFLEAFWGDWLGGDQAGDEADSKLAEPDPATGPQATVAPLEGGGAGGGEGPDAGPAAVPAGAVTGDASAPAPPTAAKDGPPTAPQNGPPQEGETARPSASAGASSHDAAPGANAGGSVPAGPDDIHARLGAALGALPHPTAPTAGAARAKLDAAAAGAEARGLARLDAIRAAPGQIAGPAPKHRPAPAPDPGPIPNQMEVVRNSTGQKLKPAMLPPLTRSPRGTLPDLTQPVLSDLEINVVQLGETAIAGMVTGTDPKGAETQARLLKVSKSLGQETAAAPVIDLGVFGALVPIPGAPVVDEQVAGLKLSPAQREMFAGVVGQLRGDTIAEAERILTAIRLAHARYPRGMLQSSFDPPLGQDLVSGISAELTATADGLAHALQIAPDKIDATIAERREEVARLKQQAEDARNGAVAGAQGAAVKADARARGAAQATASATALAVAKDRALAKPVSETQARVERTLVELREPIATELARLDSQLRLRERAIADAVRAQVSAIGLARARDEIALAPKPGELGTVESRLQIGEVGRWARTSIAKLRDGADSAQATLVAAASAQTEELKTALRSAATAAIASLRAWGAEHTKATDDWWTTLDADLQRWATEATAQAELWQNEQGQASRLALAQDLESFQRIVALQQAGDSEAVTAYMAGLDGEAKAVVMTLIQSLNGGAPDLAGALTAGIRERVRQGGQARLEKELEDRVGALQPAFDDPNWHGLLKLADAMQPGWNLVAKAEKIHTAVTRWRGHDEESIFAALEGLSPIAAKLLKIYYPHRWGQTLDDALLGKGHAGHLNKDEMATAHQFLEASPASRIEAASGAINSAISGAGAEIGEVNRILRSLPPKERAEAVARYEARYHTTLESDLSDQWSLSRAQVAESMAIAKGDVVGATAIALGASVSTIHVDGGEGGGGEPIAVIDRDKASAVYAQIRSEVEAEAASGKWLSSQVEAEITLRNRELELRFDDHAKDEWWAKDKATGATRSAFALAGGPGRDLLDGLADNDMVKVDVARLRLEDQGIYADDATINAVFREQNARSLAEVQRDLGPVLSARLDAQLREEEGTFTTEEQRVDRRMKLERENAKELAGLADAETNTRLKHLGAAYQKDSQRSLQEMVAANMSGISRDEAQTRVAQGGVLTNYQKLRFSIEGLGTDMPQLRSTLAGMTKAEMETADAAWRKAHNDQPLVDAIKDDTSGRDQKDLVDMAEHGVPETAAQVVDAARRKFDSDRADDTAAGRWLTSGEIASAEYEVKRLESQLAELRKTNQSDDARARASAGFDIAIQHANTAIEMQRQALDSVTDMLANAAAIATAVVVGIALSPFTGGGSAVVAAAVISSIAAAAVSIGVKQLVKGAAYGREELYTDMAVGAVDALVAALTAGLGNALLGRAAGSLTPVAESSLFRALSRLGSVGRAAARGQTRAAGMLGRLGTQGVLVRGLERQALLGGLHESKHMVVKLLAKGSAELIEQGVQAIPSSLTASLMDERVYRQPGGPLAVLTNTLEGSLHSTAMGLGMAGAHHLGSLGAKAGLRGMRSVADGLRVMMPSEVRMPTGDVLGHIGTPRERLAEFRAWRETNPQGSMRQFTAELKAKAIERWELADPHPERTRAAREQLLAGLPPHERGQYADVPIRSVSDADFAQLTLGKTGDAQLLVRDGQAVILLREGAPVTAARALLPQVRERVFAGTRGMAVEAALPKRLRDTSVRIDRTLPSDEVRVQPIPRDGGPITGVEVVVGPAARPIDVALHAGEVARVRRWTGRLGEARLALADFGTRLGLHMESPRERAQFEAAGEVRKLGPIIDERIRRLALAGDPHAAAAIEAQALHLLGQLERARRILTGELVVEPRGYVAAEGLPDAPPHPKGDADAPQTDAPSHADAEGEAPRAQTGLAASEGGGATGAPPAAGPAEPSARERLAAGRPDIAERFAEADARHIEEGDAGPLPSERFDVAMGQLERSGLGAPGRAVIEEIFRPAARSEELSATRFRRALEVLDHLTTLVRERPDLLTARGQKYVYGSVLDIRHDVIKSYKRGETLEGRRIRNADAPELAAAMRAMDQALSDYHARATGDPIERLVSLLGLRDQVARASEILRSYDPAFVASTTLGAPVKSRTLRGVQELPIDVRAGGRVGEPLARNLPGLGLERYMLSPRHLADLPTIPPHLGEDLARLLRGYHRAHLIGPGFGGELFEGLMLAPEGVNLNAQNDGVEHFTRVAASAGVDVSVQTHASGRRILVPLEGGGFQSVDVLTRVEYDITLQKGDGKPRTHRVVIEVTPPPNGRAIVTESTIPPDAPGGDVLDRLRVRGAAPTSGAGASSPPSTPKRRSRRRAP